MGETLALGYVHPGHVDAYFMQSVVSTMAADAQRAEPRIIGGGTVIAVGSGPRIAEARNHVVEAFLATQTEWLLMVDTDMVWSPPMIDKIIEAADPKERPIVGGLCFGGGRSGIMFPTMYRLRKAEELGDNPIEIIEDYPEDSLCQVHATGAAFLLMHRSALEKIGEHYAGAPYPWFIEGSVYRQTKFGEDWAFCMRAIEAGFPIYVHTGVKIGHVKPQILDEDSWLAFKERKDAIGEGGVAQQFKDKIMGTGPGKTAKVPTYVVIPQKNKTDMTVDLVSQLLRQGDVDGIFVFDNGSNDIEWDATQAALEPENLVDLIPASGRSLHEMWNDGVRQILDEVDGPVNIAILNNDLRVGPHFLLRQATALRADDELVAVCPNHDGRKGQGVEYVDCGREGMSGFAFMFRGELYRGRDPFDENLGWWYGDNDFALEIQLSGKRIGMVLSVKVEHIGGGSQTAKDSDFSEQIAADRQYFIDKHGFVENEDGALVLDTREEVSV